LASFSALRENLVEFREYVSTISLVAQQYLPVNGKICPTYSDQEMNGSGWSHQNIPIAFNHLQAQSKRSFTEVWRWPANCLSVVRRVIAEART
jgi:hypothetical protein